MFLEFESITDWETDKNFSIIILKVFTEHELLNCVLAVITDNAENNKILTEAVYNVLKLLSTDKLISDSALKQMLRVHQYLSCLVHVIQLTVNDMFTVMKTQSINDEIIRNWEKKDEILTKNVKLSQTLKKICFLFFYLIII